MVNNNKKNNTMNTLWSAGSILSTSPKIIKTMEKDIKETINQQEFIYMKSVPSPFPNHAWYTKLWNRISPEEQKFLFKNVYITDDEKLGIIKMGEKYSILHKTWTGIIRNTWVEWIDPYRQWHTIQWDYTDNKGNRWIKWFSYFDGLAACETTQLTPEIRLLSGEKKFRRLLSYLPWTTDEERIWSLVDLLELPYTWTYIASDDLRIQVNIMGYLRVSAPQRSETSWDSAVRIFFSKEISSMDSDNAAASGYIPTLVYERTEDYGNQEVTSDDFEYID